MPRSKPQPKRSTRSRIHTVIPGDLHEQVDLYCAHHGLSESEFFRIATIEKLAGTGDAKQLARQLSSSRRTALENQLQGRIHTELLSVLLRLSLHMLPVSKAELLAPHRQVDAHYQSLIEHVTRNLSGGKAFLSVFPEELLTPKFEETPPKRSRAPMRREAGSRATPKDSP